MTDTSTNRSGTSGSVLTDKTDELIASNKVEGTAVYNHQGERIGTLHHFMVGKRSGQVAYAVMSFGGLFGLGEKHYPLPWNELTYDMTQTGAATSLPTLHSPWLAVSSLGKPVSTRQDHQTL
jgi:hypothetical protein